MNVQILTNTLNMQSDGRQSVEARCATFEAPDHVVETACSQELRSDLFRCCKEIQMHLVKTASTVMTSGNFYFKIDPSDQLYLIFVTCLKVDKLAPCLNGHRPVVLGLKITSPTNEMNRV